MTTRVFSACGAAALVVAAFLLGTSACSPPSRHAALSLFFDGVPPLPPPGPPPGSEAAIAQAASPQKAGFREHGPYGAKLCSSCHLSTAANTYVVPKQQLCAHCHDIDLAKQYVHGPIASEGCTSCHDPHSSPYRYLLSAGPETFCYGCHDKQDVAADPAHKDTTRTCNGCHDPHASDEKHLLRPKG